MPSLLDIAPPEIATETVEIRGMPIEVHGLEARDFARLIARFPAMRRVAQPPVPQGGDGEVVAVDFPTEGVEMIVPIIALGLVEPVGEAVIERLRLSIDEMMALFNAIMRLTNPPADPLADGGVADAGAPLIVEPATN